MYDIKNCLSRFRDRLKQSRERIGLSQAELAEAIDVTPAAISAYENRDGGIAADLLFPLADRLNVNPRWLATGIGGDGNQAPISPQVIALAQKLALVPDEKLKAVSVLLGIKL